MFCTQIADADHSADVQSSGGAPQQPPLPSPPRPQATSNEPSPATATPTNKSQAPLKILIASWNVGNAMPPKNAKKIHDWIPEGGGNFDVIVVGLQESNYREKTSKDSTGAEENGPTGSATATTTDVEADPTGDNSPQTHQSKTEWESENDEYYGDDNGSDDGDGDGDDDDDELETALAEARRLAQESSSVASTQRKNSLSQRIEGEGETCPVGTESTSVDPSASPSAVVSGGGEGSSSSLETGDVIVKRSRTKKSIRKVSKLVRQVSSNLRDSVADVLDYPFNRQIYLHLGEKYALVGKVELMEMRLFVYVHTKHTVSGIEKLSIPTGLGSVLGNKVL